jgi:hypothetical protein
MTGAPAFFSASKSIAPCAGLPAVGPFSARGSDPASVDVMAVAQGFEVQREPVGKRITARLALADDPGGAIYGHRPL